LTIRITAPGGGAAGLGARVALSATGGTVSPAIITVGPGGWGQALFTAGPVTGAAEVSARLATLTATAAVTVNPPLDRPVYLPWVTR
jgi:hypothetical protein